MERIAMKLFCINLKNTDNVVNIHKDCDLFTSLKACLALLCLLTLLSE